MTYYTDLTREIAMLCLSMSLGNAEAFMQTVDHQNLTQTEYITVLSAVAVRIGGCSRYDSTKALVVAEGVTERALASYDPSNGDQTLDLMGLVTEYMRYPPDGVPTNNAAEGMLSVFRTWIDVWVGAEAAIDPNWDKSAVFPPFDHPEVIDGQTAETITNAQTRRAYENHLAKQQTFLTHQRDQLLLRRALEQYRDTYVAYARQLPRTSDVTDGMRVQANRILDKMLIGAMTQSL